MGAGNSSLGDSILFPAPESSYDESLPGLLWIEEEFPSRPPLASAASKAIEEQLKRDTHRSGHCFPAFFIPAPNKDAKYVLLYWHGNSCDLGHIREELEVLGGFVECHCLAIEFPGYGIAKGAGPVGGSAAAAPNNRRTRFSMSETINKWSRAAFNFLLWLGVPPSNIICFGRSIGTGPAAHLAATLHTEGIDVGGVVLHAPYISVHKIVAEYASVGTWLIEDHWNNAKSLRLMGKETPLLVIHGLDDEIIPTAHGRCLLEGYEGHAVKEGFFPEDSSHNAYYIIDDLGKPMQTFLAEKARGRETKPFEVLIPDFCSEKPRIEASLAATTDPPASAAAAAAEDAAAAAAAGAKGRTQTAAVVTATGEVRSAARTDVPGADAAGSGQASRAATAAATATAEKATATAAKAEAKRGDNESAAHSGFNRLLESGLLTRSTLNEIINSAILEAQAVDTPQGPDDQPKK